MRIFSKRFIPFGGPRCPRAEPTSGVPPYWQAPRHMGSHYNKETNYSKRISTFEGIKKRGPPNSGTIQIPLNFKNKIKFYLSEFRQEQSNEENFAGDLVITESWDLKEFSGIEIYQVSLVVESVDICVHSYSWIRQGQPLKPRRPAGWNANDIGSCSNSVSLLQSAGGSDYFNRRLTLCSSVLVAMQMHWRCLHHPGLHTHSLYLAVTVCVIIDVYSATCASLLQVMQLRFRSRVWGCSSPWNDSYDSFTD